ncbi:MAG TPA: cytochrome c [Pelobium sp.]
MRKTLLFVALCGLLVSIFLTACNQQTIKYQSYYSSGKAVYDTHCSNCHMQNGEGLEALIPPLTDSVFLKTNRDRLACFVVYGLKDTIVVNGKTYDGVMPAETHLTPLEIAKLLTYVTNAFGSKQGIYELEDVEKGLKVCE